MNNLTIRLETEKDYRVVEELTREAFWNVYKPGADEHYFVHMMRSHPDFIPELALVLEKDGEIILLDFKTDKNPDENKIRKNYEKQIKLYSYALEKVTGMKVSKRFIYTAKNSGIIEI